MDSQSRRPFSRFELCLLAPLAVFSAALAVFSTVYIIQHHGTVKPAAVAALCCTSFLLLVLGFVVSRRLRRPEWCRDLEAGVNRRWRMSTPTPPNTFRGMRQATADSKGSYWAIPDPRPESPGRSTLAGKVRLVVKRAFTPSLASKGSFESSVSSMTQKDRAYLFRAEMNGEDRSSMDSSEDEKGGGGLWTSVFELSGEARLDRLRQANLKRLSRESRRSRYEMNAWEDSTTRGNQDLSAVEIVVTKPEPTASPPRSRRNSSSDVKNLRNAALSCSPLQPRQSQLGREPSTRQTKSTQDLTAHSKSNVAAPAPPRRPRSAEPGSGRTHLPSKSSSAQSAEWGRHRERLLLPVAAPSPPGSRAKAPRGLRRLPNHSEHDLREVFKSGDIA